MTKLQIKRIILSLILLGVLGEIGYVVKAKIQSYISIKEAALNEKIGCSRYRSLFTNGRPETFGRERRDRPLAQRIAESERSHR